MGYLREFLLGPVRSSWFCECKKSKSNKNEIITNALSRSFAHSYVNLFDSVVVFLFIIADLCLSFLKFPFSHVRFRVVLKLRSFFHLNSYVNLKLSLYSKWVSNIQKTDGLESFLLENFNEYTFESFLGSQ